MKEIKGNIWDFHDVTKTWIVIPTNGFVKNTGECVMGRGLALDAKLRFPDLPFELGARIKEYGNVVFTFWDYHIITFPVKHNWWEEADLALVEQSAKDLKEILRYNLSQIQTPIYVPWVACGNGKRKKNDVRPILEKYLDEEDKFIVIDNE
jgi:hypothetical protein